MSSFFVARCWITSLLVARRYVLLLWRILDEGRTTFVTQCIVFTFDNNLTNYKIEDSEVQEEFEISNGSFSIFDCWIYILWDGSLVCAQGIVSSGKIKCEMGFGR